MAAVRKDSNKARLAAEAVIDDFLEWFYSSDADAGWHGPNLIARMMEFGGDLPQSSGYCAVDSMEYEIKYLRDFGPKIMHSVAIAQRLTPFYLVAVTSDRAYRGRTKVAVDPFTPHKPVEVHWTDDMIAREIGITTDNYRMRISRGYQQLEFMLAGN